MPPPPGPRRMSRRSRLAVAVGSPEEARQALESGADFVLAPARRERPRFAVPDRLAETDEPELLFAIAGDETMPAEPLRVARIRSLQALAGVEGGGYAAVLLDPERALLRVFTLEQVAGFVAACARAGVEAWLGGALELPDVPQLLVGLPSALVFEGLVAETLAEAAHIVSPDRRFDAAAPTDRVLVTNFTVPFQIGAYGFEHARTQRLRFCVEADVRRPGGVPRRMDEVYSYDIVTDAIRRLAERGHTDLVETLAEELAAELLMDGRVAAVTVRVEKLDLGPEAVGIEIRRDRGDRITD